MNWLERLQRLGLLEERTDRPSPFWPDPVMMYLSGEQVNEIRKRQYRLGFFRGCCITTFAASCLLLVALILLTL